MVAGALLNNGLILNPLGVIICFNVPMIVLIGLGLGAGFGAINAAVITRLRVAPFIATLGMLSVARGLADLSDGGDTFAEPRRNGAAAQHGVLAPRPRNPLPHPFEIILFVFVIAVAVYVAKRTAFGRRVYAVGGNERAAELAGIRVNRVKLGVYVISGICAALTGLLITSELGAAFPDTATSYELNAIAAVVLGGTSLFGGRGRSAERCWARSSSDFSTTGSCSSASPASGSMVVKGIGHRHGGRRRRGAASPPGGEGHRGRRGGCRGGGGERGDRREGLVTGNRHLKRRDRRVAEGEKQSIVIGRRGRSRDWPQWSAP